MRLLKAYDMNTVMIRIRKKDLALLRDNCKRLYLSDNPDMIDERISDSFIVGRVIKYFIGDD